MRESAHLRLVETKAPTGVNGTVPKRRPNKDVRAREYLTLAELDRLMKAARARGRHGHRDATMILVSDRKRLRMSDSSPPEDTVLQRLMHLHAEIAEYRKQVEAELAVLRARQDQQHVFNRGIALFMVEVQATLTRIERKLDD